MQHMKHYKSSVSARIIKIATLAVAMGMAMILIAVATGKGLQKEIKNKTFFQKTYVSLLYPDE